MTYSPLKRQLLLLGGFVAPLLCASGIAYVSVPPMLQASAPNATVVTLRTIPDRLEEAQAKAQARLAHLRGLTQADWEKERATIPERLPPQAIEDAVARAQRRVDDLSAMTAAQWEEERARLVRKDAARNQSRALKAIP